MRDGTDHTFSVQNLNESVQRHRLEDWLCIHALLHYWLMVQVNPVAQVVPP